MYSRWVQRRAAAADRKPGSKHCPDLEMMMADRPCRTDADLRWLWRSLLPGTSLPSCDAPRDPAPDRDGDSSPTQETADAVAKDRPQRR
jgi:hypothetical protein